MDDIMMRGMNMQQMMKQAKAMQKKMMAEHEELAKQEFVGKAPDDMVTATFSGDNQLIDLKIKPEAVDPDAEVAEPEVIDEKEGEIVEDTEN